MHLNRTLVEAEYEYEMNIKIRDHVQSVCHYQKINLSRVLCLVYNDVYIKEIDRAYISRRDRERTLSVTLD